MIRFNNEGVSFNLKGKNLLKSWISLVIKDYGKLTGEINIIFVSDAFLLEMNKKTLGHNYYTDIITFDFVEESIINGDLFISIDTVAANAQKYKCDFLQELCRVIIHGVLHLTGEDDHTGYQRKKMRAAEDKALKLLNISKITIA